MAGGATRTCGTLDGVPVTRLENGLLRVDVAPSVGGRIVGLRHLPSGYEYLWRHPSLPLRREPPGTEYDPRFYGGIDEQIPCDAPESIDGLACPDHGELWTLAIHRRGPRCGRGNGGPEHRRAVPLDVRVPARRASASGETS